MTSLQERFFAFGHSVWTLSDNLRMFRNKLPKSNIDEFLRGRDVAGNAMEVGAHALLQEHEPDPLRSFVASHTW